VVLGNAGSGHALTSGFSVFGYDVTGSTGTLFLYGIVVVAIGMLGLSMLLGGARRTARRGREARSELRQSRRKTAIVSRDRDDLLTSARPITPTRRRKFAHRCAQRRRQNQPGHGRVPSCPGPTSVSSAMRIWQPRSDLFGTLRQPYVC